MTDEELIAEARRLSPVYRHGFNDRDKSVGRLLEVLAARLESSTAARTAEDGDG